nr:golgin subfamily A member 4-like isoform X1 [Lytechinus pictus]
MSSHHSRTLGNVKVNKGIMFPPLTQALNQTNRSYFQEHNLMIHGDGVKGAPPMSPRGLEEELRTRKGSSTRPMTSARIEQMNARAAEELKELQGKEKQYHKKINNLQKAVEQLRLEVNMKEENLLKTNLKLQQIEEHFRLLYEEEKSSHEVTRQEVTEAREELREKENFVEALKQRHEQHTKELKEHLDAQITELKTKYDADIADRDRRLDNLKKQMASHLKDNSWERQQQLEELSKELGKMSEEANMLKSKLKAMSVKNKEGCPNCPSLKVQLASKEKLVLEKDAQIKQLMELCKKFESQLSQQDVIMKQFAKDKGFKTSFQPKK